MMMFYPGMNIIAFQPNLNPFIEKMEKGELTIEEILDEDSIIQDIKTNQESKFINYLTNDKIRKLIDYSTKLPSSDEHNIGHKYPFNAMEILCSENINFQNKLMSETKLNDNNDSAKNIEKGGFIFQLYNAISKASKDEKNEEKGDKGENESDEEEEDEDEMNENENKDIANGGNDNDNCKIIYENIDYLLGFLKESNETKENYVLVGYFYKILNNLINFHSNKIVQYIFDYPKRDEHDLLDLFVTNMNRKSMCEIIKKLLLFKEDFTPDINLTEKKMILLEKILKELNETNDKNKYECMCESLSMILGNKGFFIDFMKKDNLIGMIYDILMNSLKNKSKLISLLRLLSKINDNILQHFETRVTPSNKDNNDLMYILDANNQYNNSSMPEDNNAEIFKNFLLIYFNALEKNKFEFLGDFGNCAQEENGEFISTYLEPQKKIGVKKIAQVEYILSILDIFVNCYAAGDHQEKIEQLINLANTQNIFWNLHNLLFLFPHSNIYQIYYKQIMEIILNENSPNCLIEFCFIEKNENKNLVNIYIDHVLNDMKFKFKLTNTYAFNPYFAFLITILNKIFGNQNLHLKSIIDKNEDLSVYYEVIGKEVSEIFGQQLLLTQGISFGDFEDEPLKTFGKKNFLELLEEDYDIYEAYKKGENYKQMLKEKMERIEKEQKENVELMNKKEKNEMEYIDDLEQEEDPLFKVEKKGENKEKDELTALNNLNEEMNKVIENNYDANDDVNNDNMDIEDENKDKENCRVDIKELEDDVEEKNNVIIDDENQLNDDITPSPFENKVYHIDYNRNSNENENEKNNEDKKNENENENEKENKTN
jgi:hypothetical protein